MARALLIGQELIHESLRTISNVSRPAQRARSSCYHARSGESTSRARPFFFDASDLPASVAIRCDGRIDDM
jgi:hypothetical protein